MSYLTGTVCFFLTVSVFFPCDVASSNQQQDCPAMKGEPGVPGVPGPSGIRGHTGAEGPPGSQGAKGIKGEAGEEGPVGPLGIQGAQGVIGSTGKPGVSGPQGPPGKTGIMGPPGTRGPSGQAGGPGQKGDRGIVGPRGLAGVDGVPGSAGPVGPPGGRGPKGVKGNVGVTGSKGERGPQGQIGPELSEDVLKTYFAPIKGLSDRVKQLETWKQQCTACSGEVVAAHCVGSSSISYTISGVITYWSTSSPSLLMGGVTYSNGVLTVPSDGVYYIYTQIYFDPTYTGGNSVAIRINGSTAIYVYSQVHSSINTDRTKYSGAVRQLRKGDRVHVHGRGFRYYMDPHHSFFGLWKIN